MVRANTDGEFDGVWAAGGRLAGRYVLDRPLVPAGPWLATDGLRGGLAVVERVPAEALTEAFRRRLASLALAHLPGTAPATAVGIEGRDGWVAAPVPGPVTAFAPGRAVSWDMVRGPTLSLLETLARLHRAGLVHGAVGPASLVQSEDHRLLLVGLGAVPRAGPTRAPELPRAEPLGNPLDPAVDLFAVGALIYAALAGRYPPEGAPDDWPTPLHLLAPAVPRDVAATVRDLLAPDPLERAPSAAAALERLQRAPPGDLPLPLLGDRQVIDAIVLAVGSGQALDVAGDPGVGRTRSLNEAASRLARDGISVRRCVAGRRSFQSLEPVVGPVDAMDVDGVADTRVEVEQRLRFLLRSGVGVFADDFHQLDRWSRALLVAMRSVGPVIRVLGDVEDDASGALELRPLDEAALRRVVEGPERVLHLRSDAAHELWVRTGGLPGRVVVQVAAWERAGLAARDRGRLRVERAALDRLRRGLLVVPDEGPGRGVEDGLPPSERELLAWIAFGGGSVNTGVLATLTGRSRRELTMDLARLEELGLLRVDDDGQMTSGVAIDLPTPRGSGGRAPVHRQLAAALPFGSPGRLAHLVAGWQGEGVVEQGAHEVRTLLDERRPEEAVWVLRALHFLSPDAPDVARLWARTALLTSDLADLAEAGAVVGATGGEPVLDEVLSAITELEASLADLAGPAGDVGAIAARLAALDPSSDVRIELCRQEAAVACARMLGPVALAAAARTAAAALSELDLGGDAWRLEAWRAEAAAAEGRLLTAAEGFREAAGVAPSRSARLVALVGEARSLLAAGEPSDALEVAAELIEVGSRHRIVDAELWGRVVEREAGLTLGVVDEADEELVEVAAVLAPEVAGRVALVEACVAFRGGHVWKVADLAQRAEKLGGSAPSAVLAGALRIAASPRRGDDVRSIAAAAAACGDPVAGLEALGLLARAGRLEGDWREVVQQHAAVLPPGAGDRAGWLMTVQEAVQAIERVAARAR